MYYKCTILACRDSTCTCTCTCTVRIDLDVPVNVQLNGYQNGITTMPAVETFTGKNLYNTSTCPTNKNKYRVTIAFQHLHNDTKNRKKACSRTFRVLISSRDHHRRVLILYS